MNKCEYCGHIITGMSKLHRDEEGKYYTFHLQGTCYLLWLREQLKRKQEAVTKLLRRMKKCPTTSTTNSTPVGSAGKG